MLFRAQSAFPGLPSDLICKNVMYHTTSDFVLLIMLELPDSRCGPCVVSFCWQLTSHFVIRCSIKVKSYQFAFAYLICHSNLCKTDKCDVDYNLCKPDKCDVDYMKYLICIKISVTFQ
jgi:hypothetical protein